MQRYAPNKTKGTQNIKHWSMFFAVFLGLILSMGCGRGPTGPQGAPGISLLKEYGGSFQSVGDFAVTVPEIAGKQSNTFVNVYFALPSAPDIWTPMTDGWKDNAAVSRTSGVSWTFGKVYFFGMSSGDLYLIKVYQTE